ncbi:glycoside hydrolase family 15 protein [Methanobacterium sp. ACI-7]|uniref:glycoside hydrolase family 15 protein n=1 Tax=unclassified Methanobacterium TaxID=2627676 RepID=UPI0039C2D402
MNCEHYKPIGDYGAIGNLRTVALVGRDGSIDWCCFPVVDRSSIFAAILDIKRGGRFKISVPDAGIGFQYYIKDTNILKTKFKIGGGELTVTDFMPLWGDINKCGGSNAPTEIHRVLECSGDTMDVEVEWSPRFDYARSSTEIKELEDGWIATDGNDKLSMCNISNASVVDMDNGPALHAYFQIEDGDTKVLITRWNSENVSGRLDNSTKLMKRTVNTWRDWAHEEPSINAHKWAAEWFPFLIRSKLALKMMIHDDTGAMMAAPTASLPEVIGDALNCDYRYTWVRDASLVGQALISTGHMKEAVDMFNWVEKVSKEHFEKGEGLKIMYGLHGEIELEEGILEHLEGYKRSKPVHIGNGAASQLQHGIYGELLNTAYELVRRDVELEPEIMEFLSKVTDQACEVWKKKDSGIWEERKSLRHYTYSKVMIWVALDRAIHLVNQYDFPGDIEKWEKSRAEVREAILKHGYDEELGSFVRAFGGKELDAANLRIPLLEFLPFNDERVQGTINKTLEHLTKNQLVYRYLKEEGPHSKEGTFILCTFWLVDALAISGRIKEARDIFENIVNHTNHVGLLSEMIDADTGELLGNFPQAFSHIGMINSMVYLAYAEGKAVPVAPIGTSEHREKIMSSRKDY